MYGKGNIQNIIVVQDIQGFAINLVQFEFVGIQFNIQIIDCCKRGENNYMDSFLLLIFLRHFKVLMLLNTSFGGFNLIFFVETYEKY